MKQLLKTKTTVLLLCAAVLLAGCATIAPFDQHAYVQTTSLKVDALHLMGKAVNDYTAHAQEVEAFEIAVQKVYEYEKNRPKNDITTAMWEKLIKPDGHLLGGFLQRWKKEGRLGSAFVENMQEVVGGEFDKIAGLESKKIKSSDLLK